MANSRRSRKQYTIELVRQMKQEIKVLAYSLDEAERKARAEAFDSDWKVSSDQSAKLVDVVKA